MRGVWEFLILIRCCQETYAPIATCEGSSFEKDCEGFLCCRRDRRLAHHRCSCSKGCCRC
ncbi:hypothetical protein LINPERHAP2_LOCUS9993 [Linum perenne]